MRFSTLFPVLSTVVLPSSAALVKEGSRCVVTPISAAVASSEEGGLVARQSQVDDTPQILEAFSQCGQDGTIILQEGTYHIRQVMDTTNLRNVSIEIYGTLIWSADNLDYWRRASFDVVYAGRQTAWRIGGRDITMRGFGKALLDGNGQAWIDLANGASNLNGRPISLTVWYGTNVLIDGITWRMAQFWHTFVAHSENVTMTNLDMYTLSSNGRSSQNTDGTDTWNSKNIFIANWTVTCGDDCIAVKGNSTNVHVKNVVCTESGATVIGSIGSNAWQPDYVENVVFENITAKHSSNAAWIKTYPGTGYVRNVTFRNIHFEDVNQPIYLSSCICTSWPPPFPPFLSPPFFLPQTCKKKKNNNNNRKGGN
ncbi:glycoside hydrolase family 28 protein [Thermothelomyces heterothallicus CBS 203.75]